jgi:hypothetical protein
VDLGYPGLQQQHLLTGLPHKSRRNELLTAEQKNRHHTRCRVRIEPKIREFKIFKSLAEPYRNFGKKHFLRFHSIVGLINLRHGF